MHLLVVSTGGGDATAAEAGDPAEQLPSALSSAAVAGRGTAHWVPLRTANATGGLRLHAPLLICISPELAPAVCRWVLACLHSVQNGMQT
jgi:hypothetical protein